MVQRPVGADMVERWAPLTPMIAIFRIKTFLSLNIMPSSQSHMTYMTSRHLNKMIMTIVRTKAQIEGTYLRIIRIRCPLSTAKSPIPTTIRCLRGPILSSHPERALTNTRRIMITRRRTRVQMALKRRRRARSNRVKRKVNLNLRRQIRSLMKQRQIKRMGTRHLKMAQIVILRIRPSLITQQCWPAHKN